MPLGWKTGYDLHDRFHETLSEYIEFNPDPLTLLRMAVEGRTDADDEIMFDPERWANEVRAAALGDAYCGKST